MYFLILFRISISNPDKRIDRPPNPLPEGTDKIIIKHLKHRHQHKHTHSSQHPSLLLPLLHQPIQIRISQPRQYALRTQRILSTQGSSRHPDSLRNRGRLVWSCVWVKGYYWWLKIRGVFQFSEQERWESAEFLCKGQSLIGEDTF